METSYIKMVLPLHGVVNKYLSALVGSLLDDFSLDS